MTSLWQIPAAMVALLAWLTSPSTSLADAARREAFRRQVTAKSESIYSNQTLPPARPSDIAAAVSSGAATAGADGAEQKDAGVSPPAATDPSAATATGTAVPGALPADAAANDEKTWRGRTAELNNALATDTVLVESLQSRVSALQNDFFSRDDPAQRAMLGEQLARTRVELDRLKTKVEADRAAIDKLKADARRQSVPPGWLR